jgi:hypothetical protein
VGVGGLFDVVDCFRARKRGGLFPSEEAVEKAASEGHGRRSILSQLNAQTIQS